MSRNTYLNGGHGNFRTLVRMGGVVTECNELFDFSVPKHRQLGFTSGGAHLSDGLIGSDHI